MKKRAAIVGVGSTPVGRVSDRTAMELYVEASLAALRDAGIEKGEVDGVLTADSRAEPVFSHVAVFCEYLGIHPHFYATVPLGGASSTAMVQIASMAIEAGAASCVLVAAGDCMLSGLTTSGAVESMTDVGETVYEAPYGTFIPALYALVARRHMFEFGTTPEQLAAVAVTMRKHASLNPEAHMREPISVEDVLSSRMIASPLHKLDCSPVSDGAGALVMTSTKSTRSFKKSSVYLVGYGQGHTHENLSQAKDLTTFGCQVSGEKAFKMAGMRPSDIDVAMLYDCFTITLLVELEDFGFCSRGMSGPFVEEGNIALGGSLPVNTHGGLLSHAHPGRSGGMFHIIEAVKQIRGECGERQVHNAATSLVHGLGAVCSSHCTIILSGEA